MKKSEIESKYGAPLLRNMAQEQVVVKHFNLEYNDDQNLDEIRDILVQPKYKNFGELNKVTEYRGYPNPFWDSQNKRHLIDGIVDSIFDVAWDKDFYKTSHEERVQAYLQLKKKCAKIIKTIEEVAKKNQKEGNNEI